MFYGERTEWKKVVEQAETHTLLRRLKKKMGIREEDIDDYKEECILLVLFVFTVVK